jgi:hypothetical protein
VALKDDRGKLKLKDKAPSHTSWKTRFGKGYGLVLRQRGMNEHIGKILLITCYEGTEEE